MTSHIHLSTLITDPTTLKLHNNIHSYDFAGCGGKGELYPKSVISNNIVVQNAMSLFFYYSIFAKYE